MDQERLFTLAVDSLAISAYHEHNLGWSLSVGFRRADQAWGDVEHVHYRQLSTAELADVIAAEVAEALGL